ncbi:MAG: hypothetical protein WAO00_04875 [Chthoniobacterales bacterium]
MKKLLLITALALGACSKVEIQNPPLMTQEVPVPVQQSSTDRIVEIDRLLSAPLTGTQQDADMRATLRAERDALTGHSRVTRQNVAPVLPTYREPAGNQHIVVAQDAQNRNLNYLEQMTPSERKRHLEEIRALNTRTHTVVVTPNR